MLCQNPYDPENFELSPRFVKKLVEGGTGIGLLQRAQKEVTQRAFLRWLETGRNGDSELSLALGYQVGTEEEVEAPRSRGGRPHEGANWEDAERSLVHWRSFGVEDDDSPKAQKRETVALEDLDFEGFYCVEDGDWGNTTEKALQLFLKDAGYDVDFKKGVRDGGRTAGKFLTQRGCNPGALDSGLGKQTVQALQKFLAMQPDVLELKPARKKKKLVTQNNEGFPRDLKGFGRDPGTKVPQGFSKGSQEEPQRGLLGGWEQATNTFVSKKWPGGGIVGGTKSGVKEMREQPPYSEKTWHVSDKTDEANT
eukprot:Skav223800  [mRNA]  locus=scaffold575:616964:625257:- [translate_table: standard]